MKNTEAYEILRQMVNGIDPVTQKPIPVGNFCHDPKVLNALYLAMMALKAEKKDDTKEAERERRKQKRLREKRPWSNDNLDALGQLHRAGVDSAEIAFLTDRSQDEVERVIEKLQAADYDLSNLDPVNTKKHREKWEEDILRIRHQERVAVDDIAAELHRRAYGIYLRMEKLGLTGEEWGYPAEDPSGPWTELEIGQLKRCASEGKTLEEMADILGRSVRAVRGRLFYMGLIKVPPVNLRK